MNFPDIISLSEDRKSLRNQAGIALDRKTLLEIKYIVERDLSKGDEYFENLEQVSVAYFGSAKLKDCVWKFPICQQAIDLEEETIRLETICDERYKSQKSKIPKKTFIYLMRDNATGHIKIGTSKNPKFREKTLLAQVPKIELIFSCYGTFNVEKVTHEKFSQFRMRGEWFDLSDGQIEEVKNFITSECDKLA